MWTSITLPDYRLSVVLLYTKQSNIRVEERWELGNVVHKKSYPDFFMSVHLTAPDYKLLCCTVVQLNSCKVVKLNPENCTAPEYKWESANSNVL